MLAMPAKGGGFESELLERDFFRMAVASKALVDREAWHPDPDTCRSFVAPAVARLDSIKLFSSHLSLLLVVRAVPGEGWKG